MITPTRVRDPDRCEGAAYPISQDRTFIRCTSTCRGNVKIVPLVREWGCHPPPLPSAVSAFWNCAPLPLAVARVRLVRVTGDTVRCVPSRASQGGRPGGPRGRSADPEVRRRSIETLDGTRPAMAPGRVRGVLDAVRSPRRRCRPAARTAQVRHDVMGVCAVPCGVWLCGVPREWADSTAAERADCGGLRVRCF